MSDLERLRARLVDERASCDRLADEKLDLGLEVSFHRLEGKARGLSLAIEHIDIILRERPQS